MYAMFLNVERMKFKTKLVFGICLVVAYGVMESLKGHGCEQIQETRHFSGRKCVMVSGLLTVNAEKWNAKLEKWGRYQLAIAQYYV